MFADLGLPGKACRLLCSRGVAAADESFERIQILFHSTSEDISPPEPRDVDVDIATVGLVLKHLPRGLAAGPSGLRSDHLHQILRLKKTKLPDELLGCLSALVKVAAGGRIPSALSPWLTGGRVVPLNKKDGGLRPLVVGELLRSIVSTYVLAVCTGSAAQELPPYQLGFSPGAPGLQAGIFAAQSWASDLRGRFLFKIDLKNAFNTIRRSACCAAADNIDPLLASWAKWILASEPALLCGDRQIRCSTGVQQGEPLSPSCSVLAFPRSRPRWERHFRRCRKRGSWTTA